MLFLRGNQDFDAARNLVVEVYVNFSAKSDTQVTTTTRSTRPTVKDSDKVSVTYKPETEHSTKVTDSDDFPNANNGLIDLLEKEVQLFETLQGYGQQYLGAMNGKDFVALLEELGLDGYLKGLPRRQVKLLLVFAFNVLMAVLMIYTGCVVLIQIALVGTIMVVSKLYNCCKEAFCKCFKRPDKPNDTEAGASLDFRELQKIAAEHNMFLVDPRIFPYWNLGNCQNCGTKAESPAAPKVLCPAGSAHCVPKPVPDMKVLLDSAEIYRLPVPTFIPDLNSIYVGYESIPDELNTFGKSKKLNLNRSNYVTKRAILPNKSFLPDGSRKSLATIRRRPKRRAPPPPTYVSHLNHPFEVNVVIGNEDSKSTNESYAGRLSPSNPFFTG